MHSKYYESKKAKTTYILERSEYIIIALYTSSLSNSFSISYLHPREPFSLSIFVARNPEYMITIFG